MTSDATRDPFTIEPELWFALLCEGFSTDHAGRITLERVVSQFRFQMPPLSSNVPAHAHVQAALAVGVIGGMGTFTADVSLETPDGNEIWRRSEPWVFSLGGGAHSAILVEPIDQWVRETGTYRFRIRVRELAHEWPVRFEVAQQIGPAQRQEPT